jgi:molybdopterin-guanine dinucleotide biosynthesis protein A
VASARPQPTALIVLAGGRSRRWQGRDKTAQVLAGRAVLTQTVSRAIEELGGAAQGLRVVVVAPPAHPAREAITRLPVEVIWTLEHPPGGGPVAALDAGLAALEAAGGAPATVAVVAGDMPFAATAVPRLLAALTAGTLDAVLGSDPDGVRQVLLAAYRTAPLRAALAGRERAGTSLTVLVGDLGVGEIAVSERESLDLDTPERMDAAQAWLG